MEPLKSRSWLGRLLKPLRPAFREVVVMSLFINLLALALPVFILQVYDRVVFSQGLSTLQALIIGITIAIGFDFILRQARARLLQRAAVLIDARLGEALFDKLIALPLQALENRPASYWQTLFRDADTLRGMFCGATAVLAADLPFVGLFLVLIFVIAEPIAWVIAAAIPFFILLAGWSGWAVERMTRDERHAGLNREALITEMLAGRATVKALALGESYRSRWEERHVSAIERAFSRGGTGDNFTNAGLTIAAVTTVVTTAAGAIAIIDQQLTIGALIATNMLANRVISPFNQLVGVWRNHAQFKQSWERLSDVFAMGEERRESEISLDRPWGEILLDDVSFTYDKAQIPAIEGLKLQFKPGGMIGIVGNNGSGKTTLLKLIQGLYPPGHGRVTLDGADIDQFTRRELAGWIGYVPQDAVLFAGSIRDNIAATNPGTGDDEVIAAARLAGAHDGIVDLPDGYATEVGEAGAKLSGGERQRIAVARALLGDPPILLFDEVSSNLDQSAQITLCDTMLKLAPDHTIILVSHTHALLLACRHILVLDHGKVSLAGPAREVLSALTGNAEAGKTGNAEASKTGNAEGQAR